MNQIVNQKNHSMVGVGLRSNHYPYLESKPKTNVDWFEAISENYINTEGRPLEILLKVREQYPIALHGVSLSIGSAEKPSVEYLQKLKKLIERVDPVIVSDHLCWTRTPTHNSHDLLPIPFTEESLKTVSRNIDFVQNYLGRSLLLENISYYFKYKESLIDETEFMVELARTTGCQFLIDLNNIYVNSVNHGFNPMAFFDRIPIDLIGQIHLAGPTQEDGYLFDTHSGFVPDEVWKLQYC